MNRMGTRNWKLSEKAEQYRKAEDDKPNYVNQKQRLGRMGGRAPTTHLTKP